MSFKWSDSLKMHMHNLNGDWPYKCDVCKKSFNQLGVLKLRLCTHTGEQIFKCDVYKKIFQPVKFFEVASTHSYWLSAI